MGMVNRGANVEMTVWSTFSQTYVHKILNNLFSITGPQIAGATDPGRRPPGLIEFVPKLWLARTP